MLLHWFCSIWNGNKNVMILIMDRHPQMYLLANKDKRKKQILARKHPSMCLRVFFHLFLDRNEKKETNNLVWNKSCSYRQTSFLRPWQGSDQGWRSSCSGPVIAVRDSWKDLWWVPWAEEGIEYGVKVVDSQGRIIVFRSIDAGSMIYGLLMT